VIITNDEDSSAKALILLRLRSLTIDRF